MKEIFEIAANIKTPLALAGLFCVALFFIAKQAIKTDATIIKRLLNLFFILSIVAMVLGFAGYIFATMTKKYRQRTK